jgi:hypothetical protein
MHHRNDQNFIPLESVDDSIGKSVSPASSNFFVQRKPRLRVHENTPNGGTHFLKEIKSKSWDTVFVIFCGLPEFPQRRPQKPELHRLNSSSRARNAASPSTAVS